MKQFLQNSCAKGCLIYLVALLLIVGVTAFGLGGLKSKFSTSTQGVQGNGPAISFNSKPSGKSGVSSQLSQSTPDAGEPAGATPNSDGPTPTSVPPVPVEPVVPQEPQAPPTAAQREPGATEVPQPQPEPSASQPAQAVQGEQPGPQAGQEFAPVESQGGTISGEASMPFYIVQSGDTLWGIGRQYSLDVSDLRNANKVADNTIYPGQLLYLPQGETQQEGTAGDPTPGAGQEPGVPSMPHTGINKKP